jgi:S1-C subfamily serine protease
MPRPPVDRPADSTARRIAAAAEGSTLRVVASTCGLSSSGSGVAIDDDYVVTNAHVVAGSNRRGVRVATATGRLTDATVVMFDPDLDVALLHAPGLDVPALRFAARDPERGAIGATLGYPGGGALTIVPAAVTGAYEAIGRDIYGASTVRRDILELRADVDRGDSGGPFVLDDGTVGGLVFAEARTNDEVGYALTPTAVATRVAPSVGRSGSVSTGDCLEE